MYYIQSIRIRTLDNLTEKKILMKNYLLKHLCFGKNCIESPYRSRVPKKDLFKDKHSEKIELQYKYISQLTVATILSIIVICDKQTITEPKQWLQKFMLNFFNSSIVKYK